MACNFQSPGIRDIEVSSLVLSWVTCSGGSWPPCRHDTQAASGHASDHLGNRLSAPVSSAGPHLHCSLVRDAEPEPPR